MAFGDLKGTLTGNANSITNPSDLTGSVAVATGDLIFVAFCQQTSLTATGCTDNLSNTYTATNAGNDTGTQTGRAFWARASAPGTLTTVHVAASASTNDYAGFVAVIAGPVSPSPLDANPANGTSDLTSPFTCPSTGTLAQPQEIVIAWMTAPSSATFSASSPNLLAGQANNSNNAKAVIGYQAVNSTSGVAPEFTGTAPGEITLGTSSFTLDISALRWRGIDSSPEVLTRPRADMVAY